MKITPILLVLVALAGCSAIPMGLRYNEVVDGNSISYVSKRSSGPTVVFESGLGDGLSSWGEVYAVTGEFANVFAYSRPGYTAGIQEIVSAAE